MANRIIQDETSVSSAECGFCGRPARPDVLTERWTRHGHGSDCGFWVDHADFGFTAELLLTGGRAGNHLTRPPGEHS